MPIKHNLRLRERDPGYTYGMTAQEADEAFPWLQRHFEIVGKYFGRPPGGESIADVTLRVAPFLRKINREHGGQSILIVTHGGVITSFKYFIEGWDYERTRDFTNASAVNYCGVTVYEFDTKEHKLALRVDDATYY